MKEKRKELSLEGEVYGRLQLFENSLRELLRLSESSGERQGVLSQKGTEFIYMTLTEDVCRRCPKYRECFGVKKEKTLAEISTILERAAEETKVDPRMASADFRKQCVYFQPFMEEMAWLFRMLYQNRCWEQRMSGLRQIMHKQMLSQYLLIQECRRLLAAGTMVEGAKRRKLSFALLHRGFQLLEGREYIEENGLLNISLTIRPILGSRKITGILQALSAVYGGKRFRSTGGDHWIRPGKNRCYFVEEGGFQVLFGERHCSKQGENVCGDTFSFANHNKKRAVMLLSDGMGVGERAYADSQKLIEAFETMLEAGIHEEYALEILHNALLTREKTEYATLDAAVISLQTGTLKTLKAGGTATFIRHRQSVERILPTSLPPGCLTEQKFDIHCKKLYDGDMVILLSDGMLDFETISEDAPTMEELLMQIKTNNAQRFADELMHAVPIPAEGHDDDRTVLVAAVWEIGRQRGRNMSMKG